MLFPQKAFLGVKEQLLPRVGVGVSRVVSGDQTGLGLRAGGVGAVVLCEVPLVMGTRAGADDTREDKELRIGA